MIGSMVKITGTLTSEGDIRFDGTLESGEIVAKGSVYIGESGLVKANITADACTVAGRVDGNVIAKEGIEIASTGHVRGELQTSGRLVIEPGGVFVGKSTMEERPATASIDQELASDLSKKK